MLDWEITEKEALPVPEEAVPPPYPSRIGFYLIMGVIVLVAIGAVGWVSWRFREREVLLTADLTGQIRAEESARRVGNRDRIPDLIAPGIARSWRDDYISQFRTPDGETRPADVSIEKVEYNGVMAQVWVRIGAQVQRRAYEQTPLGWRRVPLTINATTFGDSAILADAGTEFAHQRTDDQFVIQLAADLPRLEQAILAWANDPTAETPPPTLLPLRIVIQPQENRPALLEPIEPRAPVLTLNSPQVVALPAEWNISGDSAVRLAVAQMVWEQLPASRINTADLPGGNRFVNALQTVVALRWALTPAEYTALAAQWQAQAKESSWQSPFFSLTLGGGAIDPFVPQTQTSVLLMVAEQYVASMENEMAWLAESHALLATATNWDEFFGATMGTTTLEFEASVRGIPAPADLPMPFTATLSPLAEDTSNIRGFAVTVEGQPHPIAIEALLGITDVTLPNGTRMNAGCAALFGELEIEGTWRENGLRLTPTRLHVNRVALPTTFTHRAPPANTVTYVASYNDTIVNNTSGIAHLAALTPDGTLDPVLLPDDPDAITLNPSE